MSKNYEEMSDFEINKRVAIALRPFLSDYKCSDGFADGEACFTSDSDNRTFNYVKWPNYAWPIILENKIKLDPRRSLEKLGWMASINDQFYAVNKNPLRAAMICFLKMKDAENNASGKLQRP